MKNLTVTVFIVLIVAVMGLYLVSFQVREIESALVTTFGKPTREITKPGWYFKWPTPIQRVYNFDSRMRVFEADLAETTTKGAVPIIVNTYIVWKIAQPWEFFNAIGTVREAESKLRSQVADTEKRIIGKHYFADFVNSDPSKIIFEDIEAEMLHDVNDAVTGAKYGIQIKALGIKQLKISEDVSTQVFDRMKSERNRRTEATIAQGSAEATKIKTDANSIRIELLAAADARAQAIRAEGDLEAAQYYKMLEADPEFAMFLQDIDTVKKTLKKNSIFVISTDVYPYYLLRDKPKILPRDPNESKEKLSQ